MNSLVRSLGVLSVLALPASADWVNATGNLSGQTGFFATPSLIVAMPGKDKILCGVNNLWSSSDGGATWVEMGAGTGSESMNNMYSQCVVFDPLDPNRFWISGGQGFKTTDGGNTFHQMWNNFTSEFMSVDFSDPQRRTLLAGVHEAKNTVYKSADGGTTWTNIGTTLPGGTSYSSHVFVVDSLTYLAVCSYNAWGQNGGGTNGIYRTTDGGQSWTSVSAVAVYRDAVVRNDSIFWAIYNGGLLCSGNKGATWTTLTTGVLANASPILLPDGRFAALTKTNTVATSLSGAAPWTGICPALAFQNGAVPKGIAYDAVRNAFFAWTWTGNTVGADQVKRYDNAVTAVSSGELRSVSSQARRTRLALEPGKLLTGERVFDLAGKQWNGRKDFKAASLFAIVPNR